MLRVVSIPKRVSEALNQGIGNASLGIEIVSIPKRVSEALNLLAHVVISFARSFFVSIPKRVSEALNLQRFRFGKLKEVSFQSLKGFQRL